MICKHILVIPIALGTRQHSNQLETVVEEKWILLQKLRALLPIRTTKIYRWRVSFVLQNFPLIEKSLTCFVDLDFFWQPFPYFVLD
jgi:hypothetical protein